MICGSRVALESLSFCVSAISVLLDEGACLPVLSFLRLMKVSGLYFQRYLESSGFLNSPI